MTTTRRTFLAASGAAFFVPAFAQGSWPTKPIRFVVPFAPGGSSEIVARSTRRRAGQAARPERLRRQQARRRRQRRDGRGGARRRPAHADPRATSARWRSTRTSSTSCRTTPTRTSGRSSLLAKVPSLYVVHPDLPAKNLKEFVALAKAKPGQLNYGSAGNGSAGHLAFEYLKMATDIFVAARALPRHRPAADRPAGRPAGRRLGRRAGDPAVHQGRQAALHRHRLDAAPRRSCPTCRRSPSRATPASR